MQATFWSEGNGDGDKMSDVKDESVTTPNDTGREATTSCSSGREVTTSCGSAATLHQ